MNVYLMTTAYVNFIHKSVREIHDVAPMNPVNFAARVITSHCFSKCD